MRTQVLSNSLSMDNPDNHAARHEALLKVENGNVATCLYCGEKKKVTSLSDLEKFTKAHEQCTQAAKF